MSYNITGLSPREAELLTWLAGSGRSVFRLSEIREHWSHGRLEARTLSRLERGGWLRRIERGLYMLLPLEAGPERAWTQDSMIIGTRLAEPSAVAYWSALRYWNLTDQIPRTVFVQTPRRKARMFLTVDSISYHLIHISTERFFGVITSGTGGLELRVTDREKSIIDTVDRPDLSGGIWQVAEAIVQSGDELDWQRLDAYAERFSSGAVLKRLGYLVETLQLETRDCRKLAQRWRTMLTAGIADLDPSEKGHGTVHRRWRIRDNIGLAAGWRGGTSDR